MQGCFEKLFNWVTLFLCNRFVHYSVLKALIIFRWMMILTSLLICSPLGGIDKLWLVWIVVWFSATVCQSNSFWKQSEFICKTLLGLLPLKKNVGYHRWVQGNNSAFLNIFTLCFGSCNIFTLVKVIPWTENMSRKCPKSKLWKVFRLHFTLM